MAANPVDYVGKSLRGKHIVLLHEDPKYAELIQLSYLHSGLELERTCLYLTYQEKSLVKRQMRKRGLDATRFEKSEQLQIVRIHDRAFDFLSAIAQIAHQSNDSRNFRRCRIVWLFDKKRYDEEQLLAHVEEDSRVQTVLEEGNCLPTSKNNGNIFRDFSGSILCSYPINQNDPAHLRIIRHHLNNHDSVILAPKHGNGAVLQSNGLKKSDMEAWIRNRLEK